MECRWRDREPQLGVAWGGGWLTVMLGTKCWKGSLVQKQKQEGEVRKAAQQVQLKLEWHFENAEPYFHGFNVDLAVFH